LNALTYKLQPAVTTGMTLNKVVSLGSKDDIVIVGAGLVGCLLAAMLIKEGFGVYLIESRHDSRKAAGTGKPINLALSTRGITAMDSIGISKEIMVETVPMKGRTVHSNGKISTFQPYSTVESEVLYSTNRRKFTQAMLTIAERFGVPIHFEHECTGIDFKSNTVTIFDKQGKLSYQKKFAACFAADGSNSFVRKAMGQSEAKRFPMKYKAFTVKATKNKDPKLTPKNAFHIWPGEDSFCTCLPEKDGSFNGAIFYSTDVDNGFGSLENAAIPLFFKNKYPDLFPLIDKIDKNFSEVRSGSLWTVYADEWTLGNTVLIGDSAHGVVPYYGLGVNTGFMDCLAIIKLIRKGGGKDKVNWPDLFKEFVPRKKDTDVLAKMSEGAADYFRKALKKPELLFRRELEIELQKRFPKRFMEAHAVMSFRTIRYTEIKQRLRLQNQILDLICGKEKSVVGQRLKQKSQILEFIQGKKSEFDDIKWAEVEKMVKEKLTEMGKKND